MNVILNVLFNLYLNFFHEIFATKLQREAYDLYFPSIEENFRADRLLAALGL